MALPHSVDSAWLAKTLGTIQTFAGSLNGSAAQDVFALTESLGAKLETPPDAIHAAIMSTLLVQACSGVMGALHPARRVEHCTCADVGWRQVVPLVRWYAGDPRDQFQQWCASFRSHFQQQHPMPLEERTASLIDAAPARRWTTATLARKLNVAPTELRAHFVARFGIAPLAYLHRRRVGMAIQLLPHMKVEAVAWEVGFRSKKNFYNCFQRLTGVSPGSVRLLSGDDYRLLQQRFADLV